MVSPWAWGSDGAVWVLVWCLACGAGGACAEVPAVGCGCGGWGEGGGGVWGGEGQVAWLVPGEVSCGRWG